MVQLKLSALDVIVMGGLLCAFAAGCGAKTYATRLNEEKKRWEYLERLDQNLDREWRSVENAVTLRAPKQFVEIPPPQPNPEIDVDEDGNPLPVPPERDPRQQLASQQFKAYLPGLLGAWQTSELDVVMDENTRKARASMYVLSNWELWKDSESAGTAQDYHITVKDLLISGLQLPEPGEDQWDDARHPAAPGYVKQKEFTTITLDVTIDEWPTELRLYNTWNESKDVLVSILFVLPKGIDARQKLDERIALCLETLTVRGEKPGSFGSPGARKTVF